jgi:hypothetical protein
MARAGARRFCLQAETELPQTTRAGEGAIRPHTFGRGVTGLTVHCKKEEYNEADW